MTRARAEGRATAFRMKVRSMEWSGDGFINAPTEVWREVPPRGENEQAEHRVRRGENPWRRTVVEQLLKPMLDEPAAVQRHPSARPEPHFERGERTFEAEPGLRYDDRYGSNVSDPKPGVVDPTPAGEIAADDQQYPGNDKRGNAEVNHQHGVGEEQT